MYTVDVDLQVALRFSFVRAKGALKRRLFVALVSDVLPQRGVVLVAASALSALVLSCKKTRSE